MLIESWEPTPQAFVVDSQSMPKRSRRESGDGLLGANVVSKLLGRVSLRHPTASVNATAFLAPISVATSPESEP